MSERPAGWAMWRVALVFALVVACSVSHFLLPYHKTEWHEFLFKVTYAPIILASLWFGIRGGLVASMTISVLYLLHVKYQLGGHLFTTNVGNTLDILLYNAIAFVTGLLSRLQLRARERAERLAEDQTRLRRELEESYEALRRQTKDLLNAEEQLRRTERLAALGELTAGIAHEVRNPLAGITGAVQILSGRDVPFEARQEFTEILKKETDRLNQAVQNILNFARTQQVQRKETNVLELIQRVFALTAKEAEHHGVTQRAEVAHVTMVVTDPLLLEHVLLNLVMNAIQAMAQGGSVTVHAESQAEGLNLTVRDSGPGIPSGMLERVFEPFFTTKAGGTGLGLSVARRIARGMGGDITVRSVPEGGAEFAVKIPLRAVTVSLTDPDKEEERIQGRG